MNSKQKGAIAVGRLIHFLSQYGIYIFTPLTDGGPVDLIAMEEGKLYKFQCKYRDGGGLAMTTEYPPNAFDFLWFTLGVSYSQKKVLDFLIPSCAIWKGSLDKNFSGLYPYSEYWQKFIIQNLPYPFGLVKVFSMVKP